MSETQETNGGNGWKERMDRFERGAEHLLQTVASHHTSIEQLFEMQRKNEVLLAEVGEFIHSLARIAQTHDTRLDASDKRLDKLEGR